MLLPAAGRISLHASGPKGSTMVTILASTPGEQDEPVLVERFLLHASGLYPFLRTISPLACQTPSAPAAYVDSIHQDHSHGT